MIFLLIVTGRYVFDRYLLRVNFPIDLNGL